MVEVNDLYNSVEAAQICGTPLETEFDNIIYDNIWSQIGPNDQNIIGITHDSAPYPISFWIRLDHI